MSWSTRNLSPYCGTCKYWKGKRNIHSISDIIQVIFPSSSEKGICKLTKKVFNAGQGGCKDHISVSR